MWQQLSPLARALVILVSALGLIKGVEYMIKKRIFISFAVEDKNIRDLLVGQANHPDTPFEFIDMSVKTPWDNKWKTHCRERIGSCDGMIALVSKNTCSAEGALWEIKCAYEQGIPVMAMYIGDAAKGCRIPLGLSGKRIHDWSWPNLKHFIENLNSRKYA